MILVTGAGGTVGSEVVRQLEAAGAAFRAAYFSPGKAEAARGRGIDAVVIDYARPETLRATLEGAERLFLLGPNAADQTRLELNAVEVARAVGVGQVVKLSVMGADEEGFILAKIHRPVERAAEASGMAWTFLRPNGFMQNVVTYMGDTIRARGEFYSACGDARISHVDVRDVAAVAVKALTGPGHEGKAYTLSGPEALTYDEIAGELSKVLGRTVRHVKLSPEELKAGMIAAGSPEGFVEVLLDLERYYREGRAGRVTGDVKRVTGREAGRFEQYARECAGVLRAP